MKPALRTYKYVLSCTISLLITQHSFSQPCPYNIDFETGSMMGWRLYTGNTIANGDLNDIILTETSFPFPGRHTLYGPSNIGELDPYGGFPINCPNGSGYSLKLGNDMGGNEAEGVSYEFTIPENRNEYSLIYHYAVVFQDPVHKINEQPRMEVEITNVTDDSLISCSSLTFIPFGSGLPGFFQSTVQSSDGTPIWCKNWSAVSINLDGMAGKTIRLFFKTADCTFRRHFGYAYIDVNSECSSEFVGATFCPDDTAVHVTAPYGYQSYRWFNKDFTQVIGTDQFIRFYPPPQAGTTVAVEVVPYAGYGCIDTFYAKLIDTLTITAFAGPDRLFCATDPVLIGTNSKPGLVYSWSPAAGLNDANIANPRASPSVTTEYTLSVRNSGGGCLNTDKVVVTSASIDSTMEVIGKARYCLGSDDSTLLKVKEADAIQWFRNNVPIDGANTSLYKVKESGTYFANLLSNLGCNINTRQQVVVIDEPTKGITYPVEYAIINMPYTLKARDFGTKVLWHPSTYLDDPSDVRPEFKSSNEQLYTITIESGAGCITVDTQMVKVVPRAEIHVPNAFTPNDDGKNDVLRPTLMGIKELKYFRIYNRWGQLLHQTTTQFEGWNGKLNGVPQAAGVVVWIAEGIGVDGRTYQRKGNSVLIR